MDLLQTFNDKSAEAGDFLRRKLFGNPDAGQGPKLTKGQRELQAWRQHNATQVQNQVKADAAAGSRAQQAYDASRSGNKAPTGSTNTAKPGGTNTPKPTAKGQNFLTKRLGGIIQHPAFGFATKLAGVGSGAHQLSQGNPWGLLSVALAAPVSTAKATALVLADQRPAGGAIYDEDGNMLPGVQLTPLTPEQKALQKKLAAQRPGKPDSSQVTEPPTAPPTEPPSEGDSGKIYLHPELKGPKGNEVGSDSDPAEPGLQGPGDPPGPPGAVRENENGLIQVGRSLSGANAALEGLGLAPLQDAARFFEGYKPAARTGGFSADDAQTMGMSKKDAETIAAGGSVETVITPTSAGATGQDASNPQAGISGAADVGEAKRTIADATSGIGPDPRFSKGAIRRASVRAFLDAPAGSGYNAIRARDAAAGISRIPGQEGVLINGEFRQFADGVDQKQMRQAAYAATGDGFATKEAQDKWSGLFLKRAEEAKADTPTAEKPAAPAEPAQEVKPGTPIKPVVIPQAVIDRAKGMTYDPSNPTKQDPEYARLRDESDAQWLATRTHKDVFDDATQSWKKVPINR